MRSNAQSLYATFHCRNFTFLLIGPLLALAAVLVMGGPAAVRAASVEQAAATHIQLSTLTMIDRQHGWALDQNETHVLSTRQGPEHWSNVTPKGLYLPGNDFNNFITASFFLDATHGYLGVLQNGLTYLLSTQDGGHTWQTTPFNIPVINGPVTIHQIDFLDARHGWLSFARDQRGPGEFDILLMSTSNGGKTWQTLLDTSQNPSALPLPIGQTSHFTFVSPQKGWVTGIYPSPDVYLYTTQDGGKTWSKPNVPAITNAISTESHGPFWRDSRSGTLFVLYLPNVSNAHDALTTYHTNDGGQNWTMGPSSPDVSTSQFALFFLNAREGWSLGIDSRGKYVVHHTGNGGQTWQVFNPTGLLQPPSEVVLDLKFLNATTGWTIIKDPTNSALHLFQTTNGGHTWRELHPIES